MTEEFIAAYQASYGQEFPSQTREVGQSATSSTTDTSLQKPTENNVQPTETSTTKNTLQAQSTSANDQPPGK